jgi:phospholipase/carboxylesterase
MNGDLHYITEEPRTPESDEGVSPLMIILHGYGADERDLMTLAPYFDPRLRTISIRAPLDLPQGGHAWFPLEFTESGLKTNREDVEKARDVLVHVVCNLQVAHGNDSNNTMLLGFSQGAAMALAVGFSAPGTASSMIALSGFFAPEMVPTDPNILRALEARSVIMTHGTDDAVITIDRSHASRDRVQQTPVRLQYNEYSMGHEINQECLADVVDWVAGMLADRGGTVP